MGILIILNIYRSPLFVGNKQSHFRPYLSGYYFRTKLKSKWNPYISQGTQKGYFGFFLTTHYVDWYEHVKAKNCNNDPSSSFLTQGNSRKCWLVYLLLWAWDSRGNDSLRPWNYCWINWLPVVIKAKEENLLQLR